MKRQRRTSYSDDRYPDVRGHLDRCLDRRQLLKGLGAVVGVAGAAAMGGCFATDGLGPVPDPDYYTVYLPEPPDVHTLYIGYGFIDYHVIVRVDRGDRAWWLEDNREALLVLIDDLLATRPLTDYEPGMPLDDVVDEISALLADEYAMEDDASLEGWRSVELVIDTYDSGEQIDGMGEDPE